MISDKYEDLNEKEKALICGGCGAKGSIIKVPNFMFEASCNKHDFAYWLGGTEADRLKADKGFLKAMLRDANKNPFYKFWAYVYYGAVRLMGSKYFNYTTH